MPRRPNKYRSSQIGSAPSGPGIKEERGGAFLGCPARWVGADSHWLGATRDFVLPVRPRPFPGILPFTLLSFPKLVLAELLRRDPAQTSSLLGRLTTLQPDYTHTLVQPLSSCPTTVERPFPACEFGSYINLSSNALSAGPSFHQGDAESAGQSSSVTGFCLH